MEEPRKGVWSPEEDNALLELVGPPYDTVNWSLISGKLVTRSPKQCRERYHQKLKPTLNHSPISRQDGEQIEFLVSIMGKRWTYIARLVGGRSDNAIKNWWYSRHGRSVRRRRPIRDGSNGDLDQKGLDGSYRHQHAFADPFRMGSAWHLNKAAPLPLPPLRSSERQPQAHSRQHYKTGGQGDHHKHMKDARMDISALLASSAP